MDTMRRDGVLHVEVRAMMPPIYTMDGVVITDLMEIAGRLDKVLLDFAADHSDSFISANIIKCSLRSWTNVRLFCFFCFIVFVFAYGSL